MKQFLGASVLLLLLTGTAMAHAKQHRPPKPLHKNAPHPYTKHEPAQHPTPVHPHR